MRRARLLERFDPMDLLKVLMPADYATAFDRPVGEPSLMSPDAISWQVFRNPVTMFIGGVAAVLLELGEARVRAAVWEHSRFRNDPADRLRRTGFAAMVMVYAARSAATTMAREVCAIHDRIAGTTACGQTYAASDPLLLRWVHATAAYGFLAAYHRYAHKMSPTECDRYYAEGRPGAILFGVQDVVGSEATFQALLAEMGPTLTPSPILHEVLQLIRNATLLPKPLRHLQHLFVRAGVDLLPRWLREQLRITQEGLATPGHGLALKGLVKVADRMVLPGGPPAMACRRMGLPSDYLLRGGWRPST